MDPKDKLQARPDTFLSPETQVKGQKFLDRVGKITDIPTLPFDTKTNVFVVVPIYRESENIENLIASWSSQEIPEGGVIEVVFLVNNKQNEHQEVIEENRITSEALKNAKLPNNIRFHVVDKFSKSNALPEGASIADVRDIAIAPVIKHLLLDGRNGLIFSTDGDTSPSPGLVKQLNKAFKQKSRFFGATRIELGFPQVMSERDKHDIYSLNQLAETENILLDYLTYGEMHGFDELLPCNGFFTADAFLDNDGFALGGEETTDQELYSVLMSSSLSRFDLDTEVVTQIQRESSRIKTSDGTHLIELKKSNNEGYFAPSNALSTILTAEVRRAVYKAISHAQPLELPKDIVDRLIHLLPVSAREAVDTLNSTIREATIFDEDEILRFYNLFLDTLQDHARFDIDEAILSYSIMIDSLFGQNDHFKRFFKPSSTEHFDPFTNLKALSEYAKSFDKNI